MSDAIDVTNTPEHLPGYQCVKSVRAFRIGRIEGNRIYSSDELFVVEETPEFIAKHPLNEPGYYVIYRDGYRSFSPAKAFEDGYLPGGQHELLSLLADARGEILRMRKSNQVLGAKVEVLDLLSGLLQGNRPCGLMAGEVDVAWKLEMMADRLRRAA